MALSFAGMCIWDKIKMSHTAIGAWMIAVMLLWGGPLRAANFYYDFLWSADHNQYFVGEELSPVLILHENNSYIFTKKNGFDSNLTLINSDDSNQVPLVFNNGLNNREDYIYFKPNSNTPRELFYTNSSILNISQDTGKILIKDKTNLEFIMPLFLADQKMLGSDIQFDSNLNLFVSAPGQEGENGKVYFFDKNSSTYTSSNFVETPSSGRTQFGGSLLSTDANLFIGAPDENSFRGAVYIYDVNESGFASSTYAELLTDSSGGSGDLFGWDMAVFGEDLAISAPYAGSVHGGQVVLFEKEGENMIQNGTISSSSSQSGDEFGYDIEFDENVLFVGAPGHDLVDGLNSGAVYIYQKSDGDWNETKITATDFSPGDRFGHSLAFKHNLLFVGAEFGDGQEVDCGSVYVFERVDSGWEFREKLFPSRSGSNQLFSSQLKVDQNLLCVTAPGLNSDGNSSIYLFRMNEATDEWELISSIDLNFFDDQERTKSSLAFKDGTIVVGNPNHNQQSGLVSGFFNPSWQADEKPSLHPIFSKSTPTILTVLEDEDSLHHQFQFEHPFDVEVTWSMVENNASTSSFELNSTTGAFFYYPEADFNGIHSFKIKASLGDSNSLHFFQVQVDAVDDDPYFTDEGDILPVAEDGSKYNDFIFPVFDADGDSLLVSLVSGNLPPLMEISDNMLVGTPVVGNSFESNYSFTVSLSDGNGGADANHTYNLVVLPRNEAPVVSFHGDINSSFSINLFEDFSPNDWGEILNDFNISDPEENNYSVSLLEEPNFGEVVITESQGYFYYPPINFHGIDKFKIRVLDDHPSNPKFTDFSIKLSIKEVNDVPVLLSSLPSGTAGENEFYEHKFEFWDPDIGDSVTLSFEGLPSWLVFDGNRTISGVPQRKDYIPEQIHSVKFRATDQRGGHFSETFNLVIEPVNYPPIIDGAPSRTFEIFEDTTDYWTLELNATDVDTSHNQLRWEVNVAPTNGLLDVIGSGANAVINYLPDANFSGVDEFVISVFDENDPISLDSVRFVANIFNVEDPPVFTSQPYPVVLRGTPWTYKIEVFDSDPNETLSVELISGLPSWLDFNETINLLSGFPDQNAETYFTVSLKVVDSLGLSAFQSFELNLLDFVNKISINEPQLGFQVISEDSNWNGGALSVTNDLGRKITWSVIENPQFGILGFEEIANGKIDYLSYVPQRNYHGDDSFIVQASDGSSSDFRIFNFTINEVPDAPEIISQYPHNLSLESHLDFNLSIFFSDGDGIESLSHEILKLPSWINMETSNFKNGEINLFGNPGLHNLGEHEIDIRIFGLEDLISTNINFKISVIEINSPVKVFHLISGNRIELDSLDIQMTEDTPSSWNLPNLIAEDVETISEELIWQVLDPPSNGSVSIDRNGSNFIYFSDDNFSGIDNFVIGISDGGVIENNYSSRTTKFPVKVTIDRLNDAPVILSIPTTQWTDEEPYLYRLDVFDSDWTWQGYPKLDLTTKLPNWLSWSDDGNGSGVLSGNPSYKDEGEFVFSFKITSGEDELMHDFNLTVNVLDYPPLVKRSGSESSIDKIRISFEEDRFDLDAWKLATALQAFDPDGSNPIIWSIHELPTSGSGISLQTNSNSFSEINYLPPDNFYGTDKFSLKITEGSNGRFSVLPFEIIVKAVPDPPVFIKEMNPEPILKAYPGAEFEVLLQAIDYDGDNIYFKIFFNESEMPNWFKVLDEDNENGTILLGGNPPYSLVSDSNFSFTVVASDSTGRFSTSTHTVIYESINFPPVIQEIDPVDIIFDKNISTENFHLFPMRAIDANNDELVWNLSTYHQPKYGEVLLIQNNGILEGMRYIPNDILPSRDTFSLEVSDGIDFDTVFVNASFDHSKFLVELPAQFPPIFENQFFSFNFFVQDDFAFGNGYTASLLHGPSWISIEKVDPTSFKILGEVPLNANGIYQLSLKVTHPNGFDTQFVNSQLEVRKIDQTTLELKGSKDLFLSMEMGIDGFSDPGVSVNDSFGNPIHLDNVTVNMPSELKVGRNIISYEYNGIKVERVLWGVGNVPFDGITGTLLIPTEASLSVGGPPHEDYLIKINQNPTLHADLFDGFSISKIDLDASQTYETPIYESEVQCSEINDFKYENSFFYALCKGQENGENLIFLNKVGVQGLSSWVTKFKINGDLHSLKVTTSPSGNVLVSGLLHGSILVGTDYIVCETPQLFAILIDHSGRVKQFSVLGDVVGDFSVSQSPNSGYWIFALEQKDENLVPFIKIVILDSSLDFVRETICSDIEKPHICIAEDHIFLFGSRQEGYPSDQNIILVKLDLFGSTVWEKRIAQNPSLQLLEPVDISYNIFGNIDLSFTFSEKSQILEDFSLVSRGGVDSVLLSLSHNVGELLWVEQFGGSGDDIITAHHANETGVLGVNITSENGFILGEDQVLTSSFGDHFFIKFQSISEPPKLLQNEILEFVVDETNVHQVKVANHLFSKGSVHSVEDWMMIINEDNQIFFSAKPTLKEWFERKDLLHTFTLRVSGENNSYEDFLVQYKLKLPDYLKSSQSVIPPLNEVKNIFGDADITGIDGNAEFSYIFGNFKGKLDFEGASNYSSSRSSSFVYLMENNEFSLIKEFIIYSDKSCSIVDLKVDEDGNAYLLGNFSGKIKFQNRSLFANSSTDIFVAKIGIDGQLKNFFSISAINEQKASALVIGNEKIYLCGSFTGNFFYGENEIESYGKSDGFLAQLNLNQPTYIDWFLPIGGSGYDVCNDVEFAEGSLVVVGDYSDDIFINQTQILLGDKQGSFCAQFSTDGILLNHYTFESVDRCTAEKVSYDPISKSFLIFGEFSAEINSADSYLSSVCDEIFIAKFTNSLTDPTFTKLNGFGNKYFDSLFTTDLGFFYLTGTFFDELLLNNKRLLSSERGDAFLAKFEASTFNVVDYYCLQSDQLDRIDAVFNFRDNNLLLGGESSFEGFSSSSNYSPNDPFLLSLEFVRDKKIGGEFVDTTAVGVDQPFTFEFRTFGWDSSQKIFQATTINVPSWSNLTLDAFGNGYLSGFAPSESGIYPIEFEIQSEDKSIVFLNVELLVIDGQPTPSIIIPIKINAKQFTNFEVPFYVENVVEEQILFSSNFPSWIEIISTDKKEYFLRGRPESNVAGENHYKLSATTLSGLSDHVNITIDVEHNFQTSLLKQEGDLNTWVTSWIGPSYFLENGWVYHAHLGWLYVQPDEFNAAWIWTERWKWLWTNDQFWDGVEGNFFSKNLDQWVFVRTDQTTNLNLIYNYQVNKWYPF